MTNDPSPRREPASPATTILIVEDDAVVADTLGLYLEKAGFRVVIARNGIDGLALAERAGVALVVLDLMIPGLAGHDVCRRLRASSALPILMLTARASEDDRVAGLEIGADDYVPKPFSPREVVARVQALLRRTRTRSEPPPPPIVIGEIEIDVWARQARVRGAAVLLTPTEFKLLETLGRAPGRVFTRQELVERAFGPDYEGLERTIDAHITNLRRKIETRRRPRYLVTARGIGYALARSPDE